MPRVRPSPRCGVQDRCFVKTHLPALRDPHRPAQRAAGHGGGAGACGSAGGAGGGWRARKAPAAAAARPRKTWPKVKAQEAQGRDGQGRVVPMDMRGDAHSSTRRCT
jgi:hypothetical protein